VALRGFKPPKIAVHSANASARLKMMAGIGAIERKYFEPASTDLTANASCDKKSTNAAE